MTDTGFTFPETLPAQIKQGASRGLNTYEIACEVSAQRNEHVTESQVVAVLIEGDKPFVEQPQAAPPIVRKPSRQIIAEVAAAHGLQPSDITGPRRHHPLVLARCEAMRKIKQEWPTHSFPMIGKLMKRDHTTVMHHLGTMASKPLCRCDERKKLEGATCEDATP